MAIRRDHELHGRRRGRNLAVLAALVALIALLFAVTIVKVGPGFGNPTAGESWGQALAEWLRGGQNDPVGEPLMQPVPGAAPAGEVTR